jgi:hypothetical protein
MAYKRYKNWPQIGGIAGMLQCLGDFGYGFPSIVPVCAAHSHSIVLAKENVVNTLLPTALVAYQYIKR